MSALAKQDHVGFVMRRSDIRHGVYIPKYYNPESAARLAQLRSTHDLVSIGELIARRQLRAVTGDEIGKMAYQPVEKGRCLTVAVRRRSAE